MKILYKNNVDEQYLSLMKGILKDGVWKNTRSGNVQSVFGRMMRFNLKEGFPLLTTKKVFYKGMIHELLWFLKGDTNIKYLVENNVHIWDDDAYRWYSSMVIKNNELIDTNSKFMEKCNKFGYDSFVKKYELLSKEDFLKKVIEQEEITFVSDCERGVKVINYIYGDLGEIYGFNWRKWDFQVDQVKEVIEKLKINPDDRRMIVTAWNPSTLDKVALPPCHILFEFYSRELSNTERLEWLWEHSNGEYDEWKSPTSATLDKLNVPKRELSLMWVQRSVDFCLGLPINIASYSLLLSMIAQCVGMAVGDVVCSLGDTHIYENHFDGCKEQLSRNPMYSLPKLWLNPDIKGIDEFTYDDIKILDYESCPSIKFPLSVG